MNEKELQELRDWSARKMGWDNHGDHYCVPDSYYIDAMVPDNTCYIMATKETTSFGLAWLPDRPESGQIWMVVERMRELGWDFNLSHETNHAWDDKFPWYAEFSKPCVIGTGPQSYESYDYYWKRENNPCLAILMAAKATEGDK